MCKPLEDAIAGPQARTSRVLLAYHAEECLILRKSMRQVPTLQQDLMAKHYERKNEEGMHLNLDLLDKVRATTEQQMARY